MRFIAGIAMSCLALLAGPSAASAADATIRVGGMTEPVMVAVGKGWFKDAGLNVEVTELPNILQYSNLLASNSIDVMDGYLPATFWNMVLAGAKFRIISGSALAVAEKNGEPARNPRAYVVRKDLHDSGAMRQVGDFVGHKIADFVPVPAKGKLSPFPVGDKIFGEAYRDVDWIYLPNESSIVSALEARHVDGARLTTRWAKIAIDKGVAVTVAKETDFVPEIQVRLVVAREDFLKANADAVAKFLKVRLRAQGYVREVQAGKHADEFKALAAKNGQTPPDVALELVQELKFTEQIADRDLRDQQQHFINVGIQKSVVPLEEVVDLSYLERAKAGEH